MKREHRYKVTVEHVHHAKPDAPLHDTLQLETRNHDEILSIVDRLGSSLAFDADTTASLAIGLKLLGEVALKHRQDPLFAPILGPLREFVHGLKERGQATSRQASIADL